MTSDPSIAPPPALVHNLRHNHVLHKEVVLLSVRTLEAPRVPSTRRVEVELREDNFYVVRVSYGFMEAPNVPRALRAAMTRGLDASIEQTSYFLGREALLSTGRSNMPRWQEVVELGTQVRL